jgi:hypothetical protein
VQPPKRTTNCRRLRASNRLYLTTLLCFLALAWVYAWSLNPRNVGVMAPESMEFKYESW